MKNILAFLTKLSKNNNRDWFEKNKNQYIEAKTTFEDFLEVFHKELVKIDESLGALNPRKMAFRIYRDVRFSKDKRPYKTNFGAGFSTKGKMEQEPGFYVHIEPGKSFLAGGIYMPDAENLAKIRQEIDYNAEAFLKMMKAASFKKYFSGLDEFDKLKTAPKGYPKDHPHIGLLQHKSFIVSYNFADKDVASPHFHKELAKVAKAIQPLNAFLKQALA